MTIRTTTIAVTALAGGVLLALGAPLAASAHVGVTPSSTAAGSSTVLTFAFSHGCGESPTTKLTFDIPASIASVSPTLNPNYTIEKVVEGDRTAQVVYTAITPVENGYRDTIELSLRLPDDAAGETLAFPVRQTCVEGETDWSEVADEGEAEPESPAPTIVVTEATGDENGHGAAPAAADEHAESASDVAATTSDDTVARVLGVGGLVVGAVGIALAISARRRRTDG
ncbi:YcnI family protein [Agromyces neolithicus]|uniref:YcnI family protein n=1 Tax=Agromyces neolithicus TaxID=269420 RepID=A0ABN2M994_9MICO